MVKEDKLVDVIRWVIIAIIIFLTYRYIKTLSTSSSESDFKGKKSGGKGSLEKGSSRPAPESRPSGKHPRHKGKHRHKSHGHRKNGRRKHGRRRPIIYAHPAYVEVYNLFGHPTDCGGGLQKCTLNKDCGEGMECNHALNTVGWGCCVPSTTSKSKVII